MLIRWPASFALGSAKRSAKPTSIDIGRTTPASVDTELIATIGVLMLFGMVMVYSATIALPDSPRFAKYESWHFLLRHSVSLIIAVGAGLAVFCVPVQRWQKLALPLFIVGLVLLTVVLIPGIGKSVYGARRWIPIGVMNLQPSELMKVFVLLYAADYVVRKQEIMHRFIKGFLPLATAMGIVGGLLLLEPDLGAFIVMVAIAMGLLFIGGINLLWFTGLIGSMSLVFSAIIYFSPWRRERMFAYLDPFDEQNILGKGYQLAQSLIAFGRGDFFGVGLGASIGKLHYLPEAHTDFLLAVIGEELGLVAVVLVIFLFYKITRRAFEIGRQAIVLNSAFAGLLAMGVGMWIGFQAFLNIGVNLGLLPTKGLTLPLMSYGGSAILCNCLALGILLRVDFENKQRMRGTKL